MSTLTFITVPFFPCITVNDSYFYISHTFGFIQSRKAEKAHMEETNATMLIPHNEKNNYAAKQN